MSSNWKLFGTGNADTFDNYKTTWGIDTSTVYRYIYDLSGGQVANGTPLTENNWKQYDTSNNPTLSANTGYWVRVDESDPFLSTSLIIGLRIRNGALEIRRQPGSAEIWLFGANNLVGTSGNLGTLNGLSDAYSFANNSIAFDTISPSYTDDDLFSIPVDWTPITTGATASYISIGNTGSLLFTLNYQETKDKDGTASNGYSKATETFGSNYYKIWIEEE